MNEKNGISYRCYRIIRWLVKLFYPKIQVEGEENLPQESCIVVGNHSQMHGPIACQLYFPGKASIWCAGQMMSCKEVPAYAYQDFWSLKPKWLRPFYKLLSYVIAPFSACVFQNADTIGVYHDARILSTFKKTVSCLQNGSRVIIFPEQDIPYNQILSHFQDKYIDIARLYYKKTGKALAFVPMYLAPNRKTMYFCKPIYFRPEQPIEEARQEITDYLMESITCKAESLPLHKVVPYKNITKKDYPYNTKTTVAEK